MKLREIEEVLLDYEFKDGVSRFRIFESFAEFSIFEIENKANIEISGKLSAECFELYGCGDDLFFDATEEGLKEMIAKAEYQIENCFRFEFFNKSGETLFITQMVVEEELSNDRLKSMCESIKSEDGEVVSAKITSTKLKKEIEILMK